MIIKNISLFFLILIYFTCCSTYKRNVECNKTLVEIKNSIQGNNLDLYSRLIDSIYLSHKTNKNYLVLLDASFKNTDGAYSELNEKIIEKLYNENFDELICYISSKGVNSAISIEFINHYYHSYLDIKNKKDCIAPFLAKSINSKLGKRKIRKVALLLQKAI